MKMEMETEYVYKNVYDIEVRRIDEKIENAVTRMEAKSDAYMARVDAAIGRMEGRLDTMNAKLNNLTWAVNLLLVVAGLAVAGVSIYLAIPH